MHDPEQWHFLNLKATQLYFRNKYPSIPVCCDIRIELWKMKHNSWHVCGDMKIINLIWIAISK